MGRLIRFGEKVKFHHAEWNHVAILDRFEDGEWYVIQAEARGVTNFRKLSEVGDSYQVVPCPAAAPLVLEFARGEVGRKYGFIQLLCDAIDLVTPLWFVAFRRPNTWVCSSLAGEALRAGGWIHRWKDSYCVTPQELFDALAHPTHSC